MDITHDPRIREFLLRHDDHRLDGEKIAVFDCDGTVIRGDIGEAMLYRQILQFQFRHSPADIWTDYPRRAELDRTFQVLAGLPDEERHLHPDFGPFAEMILSWYHGQIDDGEVEKACADIVRLYAGYTRKEVRAMADENFREGISTPVGEKELGFRRVPRGIRFLDETVALLTALHERHFEIWAVSGSNRWSVEPVFRALGVPEEKIIGIDLLDEKGILMARTEEPVPIRDKKVTALRKHTRTKPLLVASDSRNDIPLLLYSGEMRVLVNSRRRDSADFFRLGGVARDESWFVIESPTTIEGSLPRG